MRYYERSEVRFDHGCSVTPAGSPLLASTEALMVAGEVVEHIVQTDRVNVVFDFLAVDKTETRAILRRNIGVYIA